MTFRELGSGIANRRIVEVRREFAEGDVASFLTRVRGASRGQAITHVWLHEGRVIQRIPLQLGGTDWRTSSNKTLWGAGDWAVEARDVDGIVLARIDFRCVAQRR